MTPPPLRGGRHRDFHPAQKPDSKYCLNHPRVWVSSAAVWALRDRASICSLFGLIAPPLAIDLPRTWAFCMISNAARSSASGSSSLGSLCFILRNFNSLPPGGCLIFSRKISRSKSATIRDHAQNPRKANNNVHLNTERRLRAIGNPPG